MIVNPKNFQAMIISKRKNTILENLTISINDVDIKPDNSVELLEVTLDKKLYFEIHVSSNCISAGCQFNALFRLKSFQGFKERKIFIESFVYSNFNYCHLAWHFCSEK